MPSLLKVQPREAEEPMRCRLVAQEVLLCSGACVSQVCMPNLCQDMLPGSSPSSVSCTRPGLEGCSSVSQPSPPSSLSDLFFC